MLKHTLLLDQFSWSQILNIGQKIQKVIWNTELGNSLWLLSNTFSKWETQISKNITQNKIWRLDIRNKIRDLMISIDWCILKHREWIPIYRSVFCLLSPYTEKKDSWVKARLVYFCAYSRRELPFNELNQLTK